MNHSRNFIRTSVVSNSEKQFQQHVIDMARYLGWMVYHTYDSRRSEPGFPDLTMVRRGRVIFAELKVKPNKPEMEQLEWLEALGYQGRNEVYLWYPEDWDEIEAVLTSDRPPTRLEIIMKEIEATR